MKPSEVIRQAAMTARLLGYRCIRIYDHPINGRMMKWWVREMLQVYSPSDEIVYISYQTVEGKHLADDTNALGHYIVRLHMEKYYDIKTEHYWEKP